MLEQWTPQASASITPASIDNSRIIRPDYASKPYARLASLAQHEWRHGWPHTLPTIHLSESRLPINPSFEIVRSAQMYRQCGLLLTRWEKGEGLNPRAAYYLDGSLANIQEMSKYDDSFHGKVDQLPTQEELVQALGTGKLPGDTGYINRASGYADAGAAMAVLKARTRDVIKARNASGSATAVFVEGPAAVVETLMFAASAAGPVVTGARLSNGDVLRADLTLLAAGAWSTKLLPWSLSTRVKATGQALGYIVISAKEAKQLAHIPVPLDLSSGLFLFPPLPLEDGSGRFVIKVARHGWGYSYDEVVKNPEPQNAIEASDGAGQIPGELKVSFPAPGSSNKIGIEASTVLAEHVRRLGVAEADQFHFTRTCWYADTATGDWILDYAPRYGRSLFVATGGSGHGFKFAPVVGDWIVKAIEGRLDEENPRPDEAGLGSLLRDSWRWRTDEEDREAWLDEGDGSRGGPKGMVWGEEIARGADSGVGIPVA